MVMMHKWFKIFTIGSGNDQRFLVYLKRCRPILLQAVLLCLGADVFAAEEEVLVTGIKSVIVEPQPPCRFDSEKGPEMVLIEGGHYTMGSPESEEGRLDWEGPVRTVTVQTFAISRCEITVGQFRRFVDETQYLTDAEKSDDKNQIQGCVVWNNEKAEFWYDANKNWKDPGFDQTSQHPVTCINFWDARAYIEWLNLRTGVSYRLPTEAEWEYAARVNTQTRFSFGNDQGAQVQCGFANGLDQTAQAEPWVQSSWVLANCEDAYIFTAPVGHFKPNGFGLYDVHGNVWEWIEDCWHTSYEDAPLDQSAWLGQNKGDCSLRVVRGGSWLSLPRRLRSANRDGLTTDDRVSDVGFRLARTL